MRDECTDQEAAAEFEARGFVVLRGLVAGPMLGRLREDVERLVRDSNPPAAGRMLVLQDVHVFLPEVRALLEGRALQRRLRPILGSRQELVRAKLYAKVAVGGVVDWHQDFPANPHSDTGFGTAVLYLTESTRENGCLKLVPGSHTRGPVPHTLEEGWLWSVSENERQRCLLEAVDVECKAGDVSFHHSCTLHASAVVASGQPRRSLHFMIRPAGCRQVGGTVRPRTGQVILDEADQEAGS